MLTAGVTPILPATELERLGYRLPVCPIETLLVCDALCAFYVPPGKQSGQVDALVEQAMSFRN
jgi:hypothetical protein